MTTREQALEIANDVRHRNALMLAEIGAANRRTGAFHAAKIIIDGDVAVTFWRVVRAVRGVGTKRARIMLGRAQVNGEARVDDQQVIAAQRRRLAAQLVDYGKGALR